MNIDDFLKRKKVRCINRDNHRYLTENKVYDVIGAIFGRLKIRNDYGDNIWYDMTCFKLVIESAENPLQDMELTPETEASEPKFKVGDKVYFGTDPDIKTISEVGNDNDVQFAGEFGWASGYSCCHATPENYERLQATFTDIEIEQPAKELKGSDLARAMLDKGWKFVPCYVHDRSDDEAMNRKHYVLVKKGTPKSGYNFSGTGANDWKYAVPIDPRTGEPLTQVVLDE